MQAVVKCEFPCERVPYCADPENSLSKQRLNTIMLKEGYKLEDDRVVAMTMVATNEKEDGETVQGRNAAAGKQSSSHSENSSANGAVVPARHKVKKTTAAKKRKTPDSETSNQDTEKRQKKAGEKKRRKAEA